MLLAAVLGLSACNMEEEDFSCVSYPKQGLMEFTASVDGSESLSKSYLQQQSGRWNVLFDDTDSINVFTTKGAASAFGISELSKDSKLAVFSGKIDESDGYYALYPLQDASIKGNVISAVVPEVQETRYLSGSYSYDPDAAISVAYTSGADKSFRFSNATALVKMTSSLEDFYSVVFETLDGTPLAGNCSIEVSADGKISSVSGGTVSKVSVSASNRKFLVASLLPCKIKKGNLKITISTPWNSIVKYNTMDLDLKPGVMYSFAEICDLHVKVYNGASDTNPLVLSTSAFNPSITLPECDKPVAKGKELGYATSPNGKLVYKPGDVISPTSDMALYLVENTNKYCLKIETKDMVKESYDATFFIVAKDQFQGGDEITLSMDVMAKYPCESYSMLYSKDCLYTHYIAVGSPKITSQWTRVTLTGTVEKGISTSQAIGLSLNHFVGANIYYFDNISLTVNGKEQISNGDLENGLKSDQFKYYLYYNGDDLHDYQPRIPAPVVER